MEEETLIGKLERDDLSALDAVIHQYSAYVAAVIRNQLGADCPPEDVEELAADVFAALWQSRKKFRTTRLRGWLGSTARNLSRRFLRDRGQYAVPLEDTLLLSSQSVERLMEEKERDRVVRKALDALGDRDREIFLRYYFYNEATADIGAEMGLHPEAVKSRLRRGRAKLRDILKKEGYDA